MDAAATMCMKTRHNNATFHLNNNIFFGVQMNVKLTWAVANHGINNETLHDSWTAKI